VDEEQEEAFHDLRMAKDLLQDLPRIKHFLAELPSKMLIQQHRKHIHYYRMIRYITLLIMATKVEGGGEVTGEGERSE